VGVETHVSAMLELDFYLMQRSKRRNWEKKSTNQAFSRTISLSAGGGSGKSEGETAAFRDALLLCRNRQKEEMNLFLHDACPTTQMRGTG